MPFSSKNPPSGAFSLVVSNTASTVQLSAPPRINVRSARCPRIRLSAPITIDLPGAGFPRQNVQPRLQLQGEV